MRFSTVFFATAVAAGVLESRQRSCDNLPSPGAPQYRTAAKRKFFTVGKYTLKGNPNADKPSSGGHSHGGLGGMMGEGDAQTFMAAPTGSSFCGTCTVLSGQIKMFYPDGSPANVSNGIYVHHILTNGAGSQPAFVRSGAGGFAGATGAGFVGAGDDNGNRPWVYAPKDAGAFESGYHLSPTTRFSAQIVLVNYNKVPKTVCVAYDLEYLTGHVGRKVKSSLISSAGMRGPKTDRNRAVNTTSSAMPFSESGYIVTAKGHLHDGGSAMFLKIHGKNSFNCVSRATYGGVVHGTNQKTISDMSDCNSKPLRVEAGDTMTMTAEYDLKSHPLRGTTSGGEGGVMGMFRIIFAPDKTW
jgi:hypothetical protein